MIDAMESAGTSFLVDPILGTIGRVLAERVRPELVLLFGSRARGTARLDSDYDLMIVVRDPDAVEASRRVACDVLRALALPVDVLGRSVDEYLRRQHDPGFMDWMIAREGVVLFSTGAVPQRSQARVRERGRVESSLAMWMERAASDINVAEASLASVNPSVDAVCFHSHAAVEKWLKALLVVHTRAFPPKTHDLSILLGMMPRSIGAAGGVADACRVLMALYPKSRYPEAGMPSLAEAHDALAAATAVRAMVRLQPALAGYR